MDILDASYPPELKKDDAWGVLDSTKLNDYQTCPRRFFFNHVAGLSPEYTSYHLIYGQAIHAGMEKMVNSKEVEKRDSVIAEAFAEFLHVFRNADVDPLNNPKLKTEETALRIFMAYDSKYFLEDKESQTLLTEVVGVMPMGEGDFEDLVFKMDTVIKKNGEIYALEHKTASADSSPWREQWNTALQVGTYLNALYEMYPDEKIGGVIINGIIPRTKDIGLVRIHIHRDKELLNIWQNQVHNLMHEIKWAFYLLSKENSDQELMHSFPLRTTSCVSYGTKCPYMNFCINHPNPLKLMGNEMLGFSRNFWNPKKEHEKTANAFYNGNKQLIEVIQKINQDIKTES